MRTMAAHNRDERRGARTVTWFAGVGALLSVALLAFRRQPVLDPHGEAAGRGRPATPPSSEATAVGYETHDMAARDVSWVLFTLGATAAAAVGLMFLLLFLLHSGNAGNAARFTTQQRARVEPPAPHLQVHPRRDLRDVRAREDGVLNAYAWLGADHARARIPVDRAMALAVGRSLDAGPESPAANQAGAPP